MTIRLFDKKLLIQTKAFISWIFGVAAVIFTFWDTSQNNKIVCLMIVIALSILCYLYNLLKAHQLSSGNINYGGTHIEIKQGDIFSTDYKNEDTIRFFAFNEYFDTKVDNEIIAEKTLNGQVIKKEVDSIEELDQAILDNGHLADRKIEEVASRERGKKIKYELGSAFKYTDNIFFVSMTHFDDDNKAVLSIQEYIRFLINFWDEVNTFYAGKSVVITLFGSGITRIENHVYDSNELLKIILWTFKLRRIKFKMPSKVTILLDEDTNNTIDYFHLEDNFNGL